MCSSCSYNQIPTVCESGGGGLEWDSTTACYYGPCDWQRVGEKVIAEVCLWGRGPSGERMFSRLRHAEKHSQALYWWLISHTPFTPVCLFCSSAARATAVTQGTATQWLDGLKGFHLFRLKHKRLSSIQVLLHSQRSCQTLSFCLRDWGREWDTVHWLHSLRRRRFSILFYTCIYLDVFLFKLRF